MGLGLNIGRLSTNLIQQLNKNELVTIKIWVEQIIDDAGTAVAVYSTITDINAQIQPVSNQLSNNQELKHRNYYNDNTIYKRFYFPYNNPVYGLNRETQTAGDYILWNGYSYKIVEYVENFESQWLHVIGAQGIDETTP
jgi:hypothetical protein